jgi:hypothetical protein
VNRRATIRASVTARNLQLHALKGHFHGGRLMRRLRVPRAIRDDNGGKPWSGAQVAKALNIAPKSSNIKYLFSSSADFGLTTGRTADADIALTD